MLYNKNVYKTAPNKIENATNTIQETQNKLPSNLTPIFVKLGKKLCDKLPSNDQNAFLPIFVKLGKKLCDKLPSNDQNAFLKYLSKRTQNSIFLNLVDIDEIVSVVKL